VSDGLTAVAMLPYVRTHASQGTLSGMEGVQDLTVGQPTTHSFGLRYMHPL
jgi:hypothetical protein